MTRRNRAGQEALVSAILMTCLLLGCESTGPKTAVGGLGGAAAGGLLAAALGGKGPGIAAGTILGGLVGGTIGDRLDAGGREKAPGGPAQALGNSPAGHSVGWQRSRSGYTRLV